MDSGRIPKSDDSSIVELETERLRLRGHRLEDFEPSLAMWTDPDVLRYTGGSIPYASEAAWSRVLRYVGHWKLLGFGFWVIEDKESGRFAGEAGFANFKRELEPSFGDTPEAGWALAPWAHKKGYATEAMTAAVAWADRTFAGDTACMIDRANAPSLGVAARCGYREFARTTYRDSPMVLLRRAKGSTIASA